jgi:hypothetical protein
MRVWFVGEIISRYLAFFLIVALVAYIEAAFSTPSWLSIIIGGFLGGGTNLLVNWTTAEMRSNA